MPRKKRIKYSCKKTLLFTPQKGSVYTYMAKQQYKVINQQIRKKYVPFV